MTLIKILEIVKSVIQEPKVIAIFVGVLLYLNFAFYVARYQKPPRKQINVPPASSAEENEDEKNKDEGESDSSDEKN